MYVKTADGCLKSWSHPLRTPIPKSSVPFVTPTKLSGGFLLHLSGQIRLHHQQEIFPQPVAAAVSREPPKIVGS